MLLLPLSSFSRPKPSTACPTTRKKCPQSTKNRNRRPSTVLPLFFATAAAAVFTKRRARHRLACPTPRFSRHGSPAAPPPWLNDYSFVPNIATFAALPARTHSSIRTDLRSTQLLPLLRNIYDSTYLPVAVFFFFFTSGRDPRHIARPGASLRTLFYLRLSFGGVHSI